MKKLLAGFILLPSLAFSFLFPLTKSRGISVGNLNIAEPGMVAYAASYSSDPADEPKYSTQNNKTFQYLNLGSTLDYYRGDSVKVGIIDSGINYDHEDFMVNSQTKVKGTSKYYEYQTNQWVYYGATQHGYSYIDDSLGHGTNVAATVAAAINSVGGTGLAPNVELYVYKVTNSNNGYEFGAIQLALNDAVSLGLDVVNMSFQSYEHEVTYNGSTMGASTGCSTILSSYLNSAYDAGITLVGAAGNYNTNEPSYPGSNNHVINVGSLDQTATDKASFSNYGSTIDIVAPGYVHVADKGTNSSYKDTSGTSFSAPLVTAAIALYIQKNPSATPSQIESALYASCDPIDDSGSQYTNWAGNGALNVATFLGVEGGSVPTVASVSVSPSNLNLDLNGTKTANLTATVNGENNPSQTVTWTSSNTSVATVSSGGVVTAKATGSATITATSTVDTTKTGTCSVSVTDSTVHVTSVSLNKNSTSIDVGGSEILTATVLPNNATNKSVNWSTSNANVVTVSNGTISGVAAGSATITATTVDGVKTATCTVTVSAPQTQTLTISRSSFATAGGYAWYDWSEDTSSGSTINGKGELYTTTTTSMQFNKSKGNKVAALFNTTAIPGSITKIEASSSQTTIRSWTAYVTSTSCSASGTALTFGSNKTSVGTASPAVGSLTSFGTSSAGYSYFCLQENDSSASYLSQIKITYIPKSISSITVKTAPNKVTYDAGDYFDPTGLVITATYSDSTTQDISYASASTGFTFSPSTSTSLTTSDTSVTITYGGKSTTQSITVNAVKSLSSISISGYTTSFVEGDTFSFGGVVTANYDDSTSSNVTSSATFTGYNMTTLGQQTVTISYTYRNVTKTAYYSVTINAGTLSSISVSGQTTIYTKNAAFSFDGTCTATFANGYQKVVTPTNVSSPDMTTGGNKTVTISYTYNSKTVSATYEITVNAYRDVYEMTYSSLGSVSYTSGSESVGSGISVSKSGYTTIENNSLRMGSGSNTGSLTLTYTSSSISKVVVNVKSYGSDSDVSITIAGTSTAIASSYANYEKTFNSPVNSVAIATVVKSKRANIQSVTIYSSSNQNIGQSEDCVGLETFINTYMHMDYVDNLGYCKDDEHHYYSTAKTAFNALNTHQRSLFTGNTAYASEWARLSKWAEFNGDSLNSNNILASNGKNIVNIIKNNNIDKITFVIVISTAAVSIIGLYLFIKKKKEQ